MKNYIGSQQHFEDNINAYYDEKDRIDRLQEEDSKQVDNRTQCRVTYIECDNPTDGVCKCTPIEKDET